MAWRSPFACSTIIRVGGSLAPPYFINVPVGYPWSFRHNTCWVITGSSTSSNGARGIMVLSVGNVVLALSPLCFVWCNVHGLDLSWWVAIESCIKGDTWQSQSRMPLPCVKYSRTTSSYTQGNYQYTCSTTSSKHCMFVSYVERGSHPILSQYFNQWTQIVISVVFVPGTRRLRKATNQAGVVRCKIHTTSPMRELALTSTASLIRNMSYNEVVGT